MPLNTSVFPLEVFDSIIDSLAAEDDTSFTFTKTCSLVSRSFIPRSRTHIFGSVTINADNGKVPSPVTFTRTISQTPEISYYVRTLNYWVGENEFTAEGFATALGSLTNLRSLTVQTMAVQADWCDMPCRETILDLMHLPTLSYLRLLFLSRFSLSDLALCVGLKTLDLSYVTIDPLGKDVKLYQGKQPCLESFAGACLSDDLVMQLCTACRSDGKAIVDISKLQKLSLDMRDGCNYEELFKHCTQLIDVSLQYIYNFTGMASLLALSVQTLRQLHVEFELDIETEPLNLLVSELQSIAGNNSIERIKITCVAQAYKPCVLGEEWGALDKVFSSGWGRLEFLSLAFMLGFADGSLDEFEQALWKLPKRHLRGLMRSQDFQFDFNVAYEGL